MARAAFRLSLVLLAAALLFPGPARAQGKSVPKVTVEAEEVVYEFVNSNNGSGPMWSSGCTSIARVGEDVYVSEMDTSPRIPPLSNTRWRLLKRTPGGWAAVAAEEDGYRQREPCSLATDGADHVYMYVNDALPSADGEMPLAVPHLLEFTFREGGPGIRKLMPSWREAAHFTEHSYRGFAADPQRGELLMLNIDSKTGADHLCLLSPAGETVATGHIQFPIRACYPQVALNNGAAYVFAVGDIVEPVEEWRQYKFKKTGRSWDYVFRVLYYTWTPGLRTQDFLPPIEIANVDATAGFVHNDDLWVGRDGEAYLVYTQQEVATPLMRKRFFPNGSLIPSMHLAVIQDGAVVSRRTLVDGTAHAHAVSARFHETPDGVLYAVLFLTGHGGGLKLLQIRPEPAEPVFVPIPLDKPLESFSLASVRAGNRPSNVMDILGRSGSKLRYARVAIQ